MATAEATKESPVAETPKKRGAPKGPRKPSDYNSITVKWHKSATDFDPVTALDALAETMGLKTKSVQAKVKDEAGNEIPGRVTLTIDTEQSAATGKRGPKSLLPKEVRTNFFKRVNELLRDPEIAEKVSALIAESDSGKDVSAELAKLVGSVS